MVSSNQTSREVIHTQISLVIVAGGGMVENNEDKLFHVQCLYFATVFGGFQTCGS